MEVDKPKTKLTRTEIMKRCRAKLKENPDKIEVARAKDRERKRLKRAQERSEIVNGNRELKEKRRYENTKYVATYRAKVKSKKEKANQDTVKKLKVKWSTLKKENAVLKTQSWRMKVKLGSNENSTDTDENPHESRGESNLDAETPIEPSMVVTEESSERSNESVKSPSRWTLYRAKKRSMKTLPQTPLKKGSCS